ncbi:MAG: glycosyltransferase family 2 protein [Rubricoccaceae bacterium]
MRWSVVVPVLNGAHVLARTVPAVCSLVQPRPDAEAVYVDDGSTDGSAALIARLAGAAVRVVRHSGNRGRAAARNTGAAAARGEALVFLDADVIPEAGLLRGLEPALEAGVAAVAALRPGELDPSEPYHAYLAFGRRGPSHAPPGPLPWRYFVTAAAAIRRSAFEAAGGFDEHVCYGEDLALACAVARAHPAGLRYAPEARATLLDNGSLAVARDKAEAFGRNLPVIARRCPEVLAVAGLARLEAPGTLSAAFRWVATRRVLAAALERMAYHGPAGLRLRAVRYLLAHALATGYADAVSLPAQHG